MWDVKVRDCGALVVTSKRYTYTPAGLFDYSLTLNLFSAYGTPLAFYGTQLECCIQHMSEFKYSSVAEHTRCDRIKS